MAYHDKDDNFFKEGAFVNANANAGVLLRVEKYYQRIYYCTIVDAPQERQLVYFERELSPAASTAENQRKERTTIA